MILEFAPNIYRVHCNCCLASISFTLNELENNGSTIKGIRCPNCNKFLDILINDEMNSNLDTAGYFEMRKEC